MGPGMAGLAIEDIVTHFRGVWRSRWLAVSSTLSIIPWACCHLLCVEKLNEKGTRRLRAHSDATRGKQGAVQLKRRTPPTNANESLSPACCFPSSVCHWQLPSPTEGQPSAGQDGKRKASKWCRGWLALRWIAPYPSCPIFSPIFLQHLLWEFPTGTCVVENKLTRLRKKRGTPLSLSQTLVSLSQCPAARDQQGRTAHLQTL